MKALLLHNPFAGRASQCKDTKGRLFERFRELEIEVEVRSFGEDSVDEDSLAGKDILMICGGDGTIHEALPLAVRARIPVALVPLGTANVLARELGVPRDPERAAEVVRRGKIRRIRLGRADGHFFHLMAGVGADGYIIGKVGPTLKRTLGVPAFWWTGMTRFWSYPLTPFEVKIAGECFEASFAVISNSRLYGGRLQVAPRASLFDENLDVCIFTSRNHLRFISYLWGAMRGGKHIHYPDVVYRKAKEVFVVGPSETAVQVDGELFGHLPKCFALASESLEVFVP